MWRCHSPVWGTPQLCSSLPPKNFSPFPLTLLCLAGRVNKAKLPYQGVFPVFRQWTGKVLLKKFLERLFKWTNYMYCHPWQFASQPTAQCLFPFKKNPSLYFIQKYHKNKEINTKKSQDKYTFIKKRDLSDQISRHNKHCFLKCDRWRVTFSPLCSLRSSMRRARTWMGFLRRQEPMMSSRYSSMPSSCSVWPLGFIIAICSTSPCVQSRQVKWKEECKYKTDSKREN